MLKILDKVGKVIGILKDEDNEPDMKNEQVEETSKQEEKEEDK